jgi:hypothetical protein
LFKSKKSFASVEELKLRDKRLSKLRDKRDEKEKETFYLSLSPFLFLLLASSKLRDKRDEKEKETFISFFTLLIYSFLFISFSLPALSHVLSSKSKEMKKKKRHLSPFSLY